MPVSTRIFCEPWGWVPYYYGRWAFLASIGWCWVPPPVTAPVLWRPGFVAWILTPTYVSWVPLAPGEIYYGHRYYGPNSVNATNLNINKINITNVRWSGIFLSISSFALWKELRYNEFGGCRNRPKGGHRL